MIEPQLTRFSLPPRAAPVRRPPRHAGLRLRRHVASVGQRRVPAIDTPWFGAPRLALDALARRLLERPAPKLVLAALLAALAAHGALAVGGASLRPQRAAARRVEMSVVTSAVDEVLADLSAPPPPPPARSAGPAPTIAHAATSSAAPAFSVPAFTGAGSGGGPLSGFGGADAPGGASAPAAAPAPDRIVLPRPATRAPPRYPAAARRRGQEGHVVLSVLVDERGAVAQATVLEAEPPGVFDEAALAAIRGWTFTPATKNGRPAALWVKQTVRFTLE